MRQPKPGKLVRYALEEIYWTKDEFEPHLSRQIDAYKADKGRGRVPLSGRAALVLLGCRLGNSKAVQDDDVPKARNEVARLEHSLRRIARRPTS
jgi:hypothetical protein